MMFAMPARLNGRTIKRIAFRLVLLCCPLGLFGQQFDLLIRNGRVIDGSGSPAISADIGVNADRIAFLGQASAGVKAARVIDAQGLVVAPGFIDMLEHSEWNLLIDRQAFSKLTQGITRSRLKMKILCTIAAPFSINTVWRSTGTISTATSGGWKSRAPASISAPAWAPRRCVSM